MALAYREDAQVMWVLWAKWSRKGDGKLSNLASQADCTGFNLIMAKKRVFKIFSRGLFWPRIDQFTEIFD